ncbi:hypothetical protein DMB38_22340 [Streptomyces sp. WAC 06738]|uniref:hypothetical protein n=1 Tax=Streptomyces sp. WAC 06738 TaxID=2203210 RepID=UPI000F70E2CE|nr:hypothetical protein [Streptomyces sp. WAC 06738]AZM48160.1 hypothetical protein DMB38_22340 [Streptomyces sp. WAC 06738]
MVGVAAAVLLASVTAAGAEGAGAAPGPDLAVPEGTPVTGVQPGDVLRVPVKVTNKGDQPAAGVRVAIQASSGLQFVTRYEACTYTPLPRGYEYADCFFPDVLAPGATFRLPRPLRMAVAPDAYAERIDTHVEPGGDAEDADTGDNFATVEVAAENTADFRVRRAELTGAAGQTIPLDLVMRNRGPATIANLGSGEPVALIDFRVPPGTSATAVPKRCAAMTRDGRPLPDQRTGAPRYWCRTPARVPAGARVVFPFELTVERSLPEAVGRVRVRPADGSVAFPFDPVPGNDAAKVVVRGVGAVA